MGRIFETRKATMFARWNKMSKAFTRLAKDITIAVKAGGPDPAANPALRRVIQNARSVNMPKDKIEAAIKRASGQDAKDYETVLYEGYGPHGIPLLVETATDNTTRTVANMRTAFNKGGGKMGNSGSVAYLFKQLGVFKVDPAKVADREELELEMIDHGLEEMGDGTGENGEPVLVLHCEFTDFGNLQAGLESKGIEPISAESEYVPEALVDLSDEQIEEVMKLVQRLEEDDDVQKVFHNMA
jgi:YebC/PmpR family DNA-binding regulatory protein